MTVFKNFIEHAADRFGPINAIECQDQKLTFQEVKDRIQAITEREHINTKTFVLEMTRSPNSIIWFLALMTAGARVLPADPAEFSDNNLEAWADILGAKVSNMRMLDESTHLAELEFYAPSDPVQWCDESPDMHPALLYQLTSGTTGPQKAVVHTDSSLIFGASTYRDMWGLAPGQKVQLPISLAYSFGLIGGVLGGLAAGGTIVLSDPAAAKQLASRIAEPDFGMLLAVPSVYEVLSKCSVSSDVSNRTRRFLCSGAILPDTTANEFEKVFGAPILQVYGSTETGIIAANWQGLLTNDPRNVGQSAPRVLVQIADPDGALVPTGGTGAIWVSTPAMFIGYQTKSGIEKPTLRNGYYRMGDTGALSDEGHLSIDGRTSSFLNIKGRKVNPFDIENAVLKHPNVQLARAYSHRTAKGAPAISLDVIAPRATSEEILDFCKVMLPMINVPKRIRLVDHIPKTANGKIIRAPEP